MRHQTPFYLFRQAAIVAARYGLSQQGHHKKGLDTGPLAAISAKILDEVEDAWVTFNSAEKHMKAEMRELSAHMQTFPKVMADAGLTIPKATVTKVMNGFKKAVSTSWEVQLTPGNMELPPMDKFKDALLTMVRGQVRKWEEQPASAETYKPIDRDKITAFFTPFTKYLKGIERIKAEISKHITKINHGLQEMSPVLRKMPGASSAITEAHEALGDYIDTPEVWHDVQKMVELATNLDEAVKAAS